MEEIGRRLRAAREEKGISLQNAEDETRIRRKYLEALEHNREADLPGEAYLKGFLRTYGNYLGLDGPAMVEEYKARKSAASADSEAGHGRRITHTEQHPREAVAASAAQSPAGAPTVAPATAPATAPAGTPATAPAGTPATAPARAAAHTPARPAPAPRRQATESVPVAAAAERLKPVARPRRRSGGWIYSRQAGWTLLALIAAVAVWYGATHIPGMLKPKAVADTAPPKETTVVSTTPPPTTTTPAPQPEPPKVEMKKGTGDKANEVTFTVPASDIQLRVEPGTDRVWYEATVDGKVVFSETTTAPHDFKGGSIKLHMGHMDDVSLVINGQRIDKPLEDGPWWLIFTTK